MNTKKSLCVYILANKRNGTIYTGVTSNLVKRTYQYNHKLVDGFTKKYNVHRLVWCELHQDMFSAIQREKQIKSGSRKKKLELIEENNPEWKDLYKDIIQ